MKIFRAYDIRGEYPRDINDQTAYKIGRCIIKLLRAKNLVLGTDASLKSPYIRENVMKGALDEGANVMILAWQEQTLFILLRGIISLTRV